MNKYTLIIYLSSLFISHVSYGQVSYVLSGQVVDASKQDVSTGDVFLLSIKDSAIVKNALVLNGKFSFDTVNAGDYILKISCAGYLEELQPVTIAGNKNVTIALKQVVGALQEVTVTDSKKAFTMENGNIKVNVANSVFSSISNPLDLLSKIPKVQVSADKLSVSVVGKGNALIYVDNQKSSLEDLNSLSVDDIKSIEVINNPSAKYEADGRAVILVTRKVNKKQGTKVDISENAIYGEFFNNRAGINVSNKKNKLEVHANFQYNQLNPWESNSNTFSIDSSQIAANYKIVAITKETQFLGGAGIFYQINADDYFSILANARTQTESTQATTNSYIKNEGAENNIVTVSNDKNPRMFFNSNLNYNKKLKKINGELFIGAQYSGYKYDVASNIYNNYNNTQDSFTGNQYQKSYNNVASARIDFDKTFENKIKWALGVNVSGVKSNSIFNIYNYSPPDTSNSNYNYKEGNYAVYTELSGKIRKVAYTAGLRLETTQVHSGYVDSTALVSKNAAQLFPKITIDIPLDSNKTLTFNYSKSISRLDYSTAIQRTSYINPFFEFVDNLNIDPTITNDLWVNFQYKNNSIKLGYYQIDAPVYGSFTFNPATVVLSRQDINFNSESGAYIDVTIPIKYKFFTSTNEAYIYIDKIKDPQAVYGAVKPGLYYYSTNAFALPKAYTFSIIGWAQTKQYAGVLETGGQLSVDLLLSKTFYKKFNCTVACYNVFKGTNYNEQFTINGISSNGYYYNSRQISIDCKYSFGNIKDSKYTDNEVEDNPSRAK